MSTPDVVVEKLQKIDAIEKSQQENMAQFKELNKSVSVIADYIAKSAETQKSQEELKTEIQKSYDEKFQSQALQIEALEKKNKQPANIGAVDITPVDVLERQLMKSYVTELENPTKLTERLCKNEEYIKKSAMVLQNEIKTNKNSPYAAFSDVLFSSDISKSIHNSVDSSLGGLLANAPLILPIQRQLLPMSPIRSIATIRIMNTKEATMPIIDNYGNAKFLELNAKKYDTENTVGSLSSKKVSVVQCYFPFEIYQDFLREINNNVYGISYFNEMLNIASQQIQIKFNEAYINGDTIGNGGVIEGLIPDASKTFEVVKSYDYQIDKIGFVKSGDAFGITRDSLITLKRSLPSTLPNKVFIMNSETLAEVEKLKDQNGRYLFSYNTKEGFTNGMIEGMILGVPVIIDDTMPNIATNSFPIIYGNISQSYTIIDGWNANQELLTREAVGGGTVDLYIARLFSTAMRTGFQSYRLYKISA